MPFSPKFLNKKNYRIVVLIGSGTLFAWVAHSDGADLHDRVNESLMRLKQNGTLSKLQMKWFGCRNWPVAFAK